MSHTATSNLNDRQSLEILIKREKEALVSMFLSNASISELADQYKLIDELNRKISDKGRD